MKAIRVYGQVQGVFFRKNAQQKAEEMNLHGYVKNMENGSVYIEVEGDQDMEEKFIDWCQSSPGNSRVENVESQELPDRNYEYFEVRD